MAIPNRNADPGHVVDAGRTFFVTTKTYMGRHLLQSERSAALLVEVLRSCIRARRFQLHDFVIMPNHLHLLITPSSDVTIEKAMQFIKGGFSFRLRRETGYAGEVWQRGFSDHRVRDLGSFDNHRRYIAANPVRAGLATSPGQYPWCFATLAREKDAHAPQS
jgi:putative transposase